MGKGKGKRTVYSLSYCKFLDLLLTTLRGFVVGRVGGRVFVAGTEKKEIYILYINIYVNCIVLLYRRWHCCLFIPLPLPALLVGAVDTWPRFLDPRTVTQAHLDSIRRPSPVCIKTGAL